jgi:hypothetical protein
MYSELKKRVGSTEDINVDPKRKGIIILSDQNYFTSLENMKSLYLTRAKIDMKAESEKWDHFLSKSVIEKERLHEFIGNYLAGSNIKTVLITNESNDAMFFFDTLRELFSYFYDVVHQPLDSFEYKNEMLNVITTDQNIYDIKIPETVVIPVKFKNYINNTTDPGKTFDEEDKSYIIKRSIIAYNKLVARGGI